MEIQRKVKYEDELTPGFLKEIEEMSRCENIDQCIQFQIPPWRHGRFFFFGTECIILLPFRLIVHCPAVGVPEDVLNPHPCIRVSAGGAFYVFTESMLQETCLSLDLQVFRRGSPAVLDDA